MTSTNERLTLIGAGRVVAVLSACGFILTNSVIAQDRVYPKQGITASGTIVELNAVEVTIEVRGKNQKYEIADVRKITFDKEPRGLGRAREHYLNDQFDQALEEIKKVDDAAIMRTIVQQDVLFYQHYCEGKLGLAGKGDKTVAIRGLLELATGNPNTHHLFELSELLGQLHIAVGKPEEATKYFGMLVNRAPGADTKAIGVYRLGELALTTNKVSDAKTRFRQLVGAQSNSPEMARLKSLAEVGLAACENVEGDSQAALKRLDALVAKHDSTDLALFAKIFNAKGACFESLGKPQDALLSYLKTDLLFSTEAEAHAEALYHLKKLWPQVGNAARAAEAGSRLVDQYAASTWANKP